MTWAIVRCWVGGRMISQLEFRIYQKISLQKSKMKVDLKWASVSLLPSNPYSVHEKSGQAVLGFAFERQKGVHAVGDDTRRDFDAWPGELAITPPHVDLFSESDKGGEYLTVHIGNSDEFGELPKFFTRPRTVIPGDRQAVMLGLKLRRLMFSPHAQHLEIEEQVAQLLNVSLAKLKPSRRSPSITVTERKIHPRILDYIEENLCGRVSLDELALVAGMPKLRFLRSFTGAIGMTPHNFITERRLQRARALIISTDDSFASVAYESGFAHQSHLASLFQRQLGLTPSQYRKNARHAKTF